MRGRNVPAKAIVEALRKRLVPKIKGASHVENALAAKLGYSSIAIWKWRNRGKRLGPAQIANLVVKAQRHAQRESIRPIVEFFDFNATNEKLDTNGRVIKTYKKYRLFASENKYEAGVRGQLEQSRGVYLFYDSRGRALYVGKASEQSLWNEIHSALNRTRDVQRVLRVKHPTRGVRFRPSEEKSRQIKRTRMQLHELAQYLSAYEVSPAVIGVFEATLVRSFANDLLNVRMERFVKRKR